MNQTAEERYDNSTKENERKEEFVLLRLQEPDRFKQLCDFFNLNPSYDYELVQYNKPSLSKYVKCVSDSIKSREDFAIIRKDTRERVKLIELKTIKNKTDPLCNPNNPLFRLSFFMFSQKKHKTFSDMLHAKNYLEDELFCGFVYYYEKYDIFFACDRTLFEEAMDLYEKNLLEKDTSIYKEVWIETKNLKNGINYAMCYNPNSKRVLKLSNSCKSKLIHQQKLSIKVDNDKRDYVSISSL